MPISVKTLHELPVRLQQLEWFAPYGGGSNGQVADPLRSILFSFVDDHLYQLVITYDRARTEGLTDADLVESLSTTYGTAMLADRSPTPGTTPASTPVVAARWRSADAGVVLYRGLYGSEYQLVVTATSRAAEARVAMVESVRLEAVDAPRRERASRQRQADDEQAAKDKARLAEQGRIQALDRSLRRNFRRFHDRQSRRRRGRAHPLGPHGRGLGSPGSHPPHPRPRQALTPPRSRVTGVVARLTRPSRRRARASAWDTAA